jgi:NADPH2:quinone reductase
MRAVGYRRPGPIDGDGALHDIELPDPVPSGRDLLVRVEAVSVNPVDAKIRSAVAPSGEWGVLGYDAAGVVVETGPEVSGFSVGDEVYYAGTKDRPGTNAELHLVDERIVGPKPASLGFAEAAALPLTSVTAWEMLFDRLDVHRPTVEGAGAILVIGGAGGVGSISVQLLRTLTGLTIIATASGEDAVRWVQQCGAHHVVDHRQPLAPQVSALDVEAPGFVFATTHSDEHLPDVAELMAPQGRFGLIDDPQDLQVRLLKPKALSLHWEFMFARPIFGTPDVAEQGRILSELAGLVDAGRIRTTLTEVAGRIDAATLSRAHARLETGSGRGKVVLAGFG